MKGRLIVIEGLDGSGKATQSALLQKSLGENGVKASILSFPCYDDESSALVRMYLSGQLGTRPDDVNCYAASLFFAVDRYASFKKAWGEEYANGGVFIADRYVSSNAVFQAAKLKQGEREDYLKWLSDLEYEKLGIPRPDAVIYLDMLPDVCEGLMSARYKSDDSKKDIHERDEGFQKRAREAALFAAKLEGWRVVRCDDGVKPLTQTEIAKEVYNICGEIL